MRRAPDQQGENFSNDPSFGKLTGLSLAGGVFLQEFIGADVESVMALLASLLLCFGSACPHSGVRPITSCPQGCSLRGLRPPGAALVVTGINALSVTAHSTAILAEASPFAGIVDDLDLMVPLRREESSFSK